MTENKSTSSPILDALRKIQYLKKFLANNWIWLSLLSIILAAIPTWYSLTGKKTYFATTTIMVEAGGMSGGGLSSYIGLASQFGMLPGGMGGGALDEDKVLKLISSRKILSKTLLRKATINNKNDLLANHYIDIFEMQKKYDEATGVTNFRFSATDEEKCSLVEDSLLHLITFHFSSTLIKTQKDLKSKIIDITIRRIPSEEFLLYFSKFLIESISEYYYQNKTQKDRETLQLIQMRADSITDALRNAESNYARWKDGSFNTIKAQGNIEELRLKREIQILTIMNSEVIKNLELSKFNLQLNTPIIQTIDKPILPIPLGRSSRPWFPYFIFFSTFCIWFTGISTALIIRKKFLEALANEKSQQIEAIN